MDGRLISNIHVGSDLEREHDTQTIVGEGFVTQVEIALRLMQRDFEQQLDIPNQRTPCVTYLSHIIDILFSPQASSHYILN